MLKIHPRLDPLHKIQALYDSEISGEIRWFFDMGFQWRLGDKWNGTKASGSCDTFEEAMEQLWQVAKNRYPRAECFKDSVS